MRRSSFRYTKLTQVCASVLIGGLLAGCAVSPKSDVEPSAYVISQSGISQIAAKTQSGVETSYDSPNAMLENADMAAFMLEARDAYLKSEKSGAWGFTAVDMMLAGQYTEALTVLNEMPQQTTPWAAMTSDFLRPWILGAKGDVELAKEAMLAQKDTMPNHSFRGYQALLLEGVGLYEEALGIYQQGPDFFVNPDEDDVDTAEAYQKFIAESLAFNAERILALRHADLLVKLDRDAEAMVIYTSLLHANEDDAYTNARMKELSSGEKKVKPFHTAHTALGVALADQAELIQQREVFAGMVLAKGAKSPFNHFLSAIRQTAALLNPSSLEIRQIEADNLYQYGFFDAAARFALAGNVEDDDAKASLLIRASEAHLEAGNSEAMESLNKRALTLTDEPFTLLNIADLMVRISDTDRADALIMQILDKEDLDPKTRAYANILFAENKQQAGDLLAASQAARVAVEVDDSDQTRGFLASTLTKSDVTREEGLDIYRELFIQSPDSPSMMNNFGYALIVNATTDKELDEGFRLLKRANRITPFEPNLLDSLGWAYYLYGDYERAEEYISKALDLFLPFDHWELHSHLGDVYWRLGREDDARASWQTSLDQFPPALDRATIASKLENGLTEAAPVPRVPPFVPKNEAPPKIRSI